MELTKTKVAEIRKRLEAKNSIFAQKRYLDSMYLPSKIIGRQKEAELLLDHLLSLKDGFVVPMVSVYGRSGSGKSTVVKFVCDSISDVASYRYVNLRKAKTIFGCANMILSEMGAESLSSAQGLNSAIDCMECQIESILKKDSSKFFVLVLDEYDVIFSDTRGNPSDFVYKILQLEENLRERGVYLCVVTVSNNALDERELDDRIKSRMGTAEVSFLPYKKQDVLGILLERCKKAFKIKIPKNVLEYCSELCSTDHEDARRALDLLRTAGELCDGKKITTQDIDAAANRLQKDRASEIVSGGSYHMRCVMGAICSFCIVHDQVWSATSQIYKKYTELVSKENKPLAYRRVSDILVELDDAGLLVSRAYSRGRNGYGKEYKLKIGPELVGPAVDKKFYDSLVEQKNQIDGQQKYLNYLKSTGNRRLGALYKNLFDSQ